MDGGFVGGEEGEGRLFGRACVGGDIARALLVGLGGCVSSGRKREDWEDVLVGECHFGWLLRVEVSRVVDGSGCGLCLVGVG